MPKKSSTAPDRTHERTINKRASDELLTELPGKLQRIGIAADHGGYELKKYPAGKMRAAGHDMVDFGDGRTKEDDDYPAFIVPHARLPPGRWIAALHRFTYWTAMMRRTFQRTVELPVSCLAADRNCASSRNFGRRHVAKTAGWANWKSWSRNPMATMIFLE